MKPEQETNFYKPEDDAQPAPKDKGKSVSWTASEFIDHQRGAGWYLLLLLITAALAAAVYFLTKDYFATGIIVALGILVGVFVGRKPRPVDFELSSSGFKAGPRSYSYNQFKSFSVMHEGAQVSLNLLPIKRFMPMVSAYFDPKDEEAIMDLAGEHLPYEERQPDMVDRLGARLRL